MSPFHQVVGSLPHPPPSSRRKGWEGRGPPSTSPDRIPCIHPLLFHTNRGRHGTRRELGGRDTEVGREHQEARRRGEGQESTGERRTSDTGEDRETNTRMKTTKASNPNARPPEDGSGRDSGWTEVPPPTTSDAIGMRCTTVDGTRAIRGWNVDDRARPPDPYRRKERKAQTRNHGHDADPSRRSNGRRPNRPVRMHTPRMPSTSHLPREPCEERRRRKRSRSHETSKDDPRRETDGTRIPYGPLDAAAGEIETGRGHGNEGVDRNREPSRRTSIARTRRNDPESEA